MLELKNAGRQFSANHLACIRGQQCLFTDFHFYLESGQSLYIKGQNGSGKTSLLRLLAGLAEPQAGDILWCGQSIQEGSSGFQAELQADFRAKRIFLGYQNNLNLSLSPLENIRLAWAIEQGVILNDLVIQQALQKLGLNIFNNSKNNIHVSPCYRLSSGQRRRVALTRLVLSQATLWLLDEPFTALDEAGIQIVKQLMSEHLERGGMIIYSSHLPIQADMLGKQYVYEL